MKTKTKVIVIVGPTASGKTALSIEIAKHIDGEIISADSRQVYRGLDVGTGKVTKEEMDGVPHHLLDVADPMDVYNVSDFVRDARAAIEEIAEHGKLPIIAGGTFFYVDALLGKISTPEVPPNRELRGKLEAMSADALYTALLKSDGRRASYIDPHNKRRLIRALEVVEALGKVPEEKPEELYDVLTIGIDIPKSELHNNIHEWLHTHVDLGMIEEVEELQKNNVSSERMEELGLEYRYIARFQKGEMKKDEMLEELETKTKQFAKRQMTWLKRDPSIKWFKKSESDNIIATIKKFLAS